MRQISGTDIAKEIIKNIRLRGAPKKTLAAILVGNNPASESFMKQKIKAAEKTGVDFRVYRFPESAQTDDLRDEVKRIAGLDRIGGIIIQLPLPPHIDKQFILDAVPEEKDPDVLSQKSFDAFSADEESIAPPAVEVVKEIMKRERIDVNKIKTTIVGAGNLVGKPISVWLKNRAAKVVLIKRNDCFDPLKTADLVILGTGQPHLIKPQVLKKGAGVIDFGCSFIETEKGRRICGDFDPSEKIDGLVSFYTPTPGGTGPVLVAKLIENFVRLCEKR